HGKHTLGAETLGLLNPLVNLDFARDLTFSWYYSDARARTDIPNEVYISAEDTIDPVTGAVLDTRVRSSGSAADYRFTELRDDVHSYGWQLSKPFELGNFAIELCGGGDYYEKGRSYLQTQLSLGSTSAPASSLQGTPGK